MGAPFNQFGSHVRESLLSDTVSMSPHKNNPFTNISNAELRGLK